MELTQADIDRVVSAALAEDLGSGDATTLALVPEDARCRAELLARRAGRRVRLPVAAAVFRALDPARAGRGASSRKATAVSDVPAVVAAVEGPARAILTGERLALNLLGRLCGIATLDARYVDAVEGTARPSSTPARRPPACGRSRSTPFAAAAARTTALGLYDGGAREGEPPPGRRRRHRGGRGLDGRVARAAGRGRGRDARRRSREALDGGAPGSCSTTWPRGGARGGRARRAAAPSSRRPAASPSAPSAPTPRPASTSSPSAP